MKNSEIMKAIILFTCFLGLALSQSGEDEEHKHLQDVATNIMQNLQKEHIPSEGSNSGTPNAPINHLNSHLITKTDKMKVTVGVKGVQFVSVEANGKVVNISTTFGVGAVAVYTIDREDTEEQIEEYQLLMADEAEKEIDDTLESMQEEYLSDNLTAKYNETKIILAKRAKFDMKVKSKRNDKKEFEVIVNQGYVVAAKMNVTKGYTDQFLNF